MTPGARVERESFRDICREFLIQAYPEQTAGWIENEAAAAVDEVRREVRTDYPAEPPRPAANRSAATVGGAAKRTLRPLLDTDPHAIDSYRLLGVLGGGGMGRVYLGESRSGRRVAIKVVRSELAADPSWRRRFAREVAAVRSVNPLFTASMVDANTEAREPWFATTYIDGPSLAGRVADSGPLAPGAVLVLAAGLAEALASFHRAGLVHRDLKPSNVIINDAGPHIIDFGIALAAETPATTSVLLGTPSYIAPERIHGSEADPASDIFSLGATLAFAATGHSLVTEGPVYAQLMQITTGRFDLSSIPADLRPLIVRCVSHQPKDRPTAEELSRILAAARVPGPTPGWYSARDQVSTVPRVPGITALTRRRLLISGGLVTAAAATAGAAAVLLPPVPPVPRASQVTRPSGPPPLPPPQPGEAVWHAASGAQPVPVSPGTRTMGMRILVDADHVITANGPEVFATSPTGTPLWKVTLPAGLVTLRRWGSDILVNDARRFWLFNEGGTQLFKAEVAADEEAGYASDNSDNLAVQIGEVALGADLAFASLGTATIAFDRKGILIWRTPRPPRRGTEIRPAAGGPAAAAGQFLLTHNVGPDFVHTALRRGSNGVQVWSQMYPAVPDEEDERPPGPPPPPGGGGGGPGTGPENDEDWLRPEARLVEPYAVLREARTVHVFDLSTNELAWDRTSTTPVVAIEVVGGLVLVAADRLTAYNLANGGAQRWQVDQRGVRMAGTVDGQLVIAAGSGFVAAYDMDGAARWKTTIPAEFSEAAIDDVVVDAHTAYVTFKARGQRRDPLDADVLAIALDGQARRN